MRRFFGDQFGDTPSQRPSFKQRGLGSGVIVASDGFVLTNHHVIDGADVVRVDLGSEPITFAWKERPSTTARVS